MISELAAYPALRETFTTASEVLGYDLWKLIQEGPEQELNMTPKTQPAMLAAGVAVWRIWRQHSGRLPSLMAGHSLGEYTALVCAGALEFTAAIALVAKRGQYMQETMPAGQGAMAAILGLGDEEVRKICAAVAQGDVISAANFNAPGQVVIAGRSSAVSRAVALAKQSGAKKAVMLAVSVPSHCALMESAARRLAQDLQETRLKKPAIPVINNVDVTVCSDPGILRENLAKQLYYPVRWVEIIQKMAREGIRNLVECGPGKVLVSLNKRIVPEMTALPTHGSESLKLALDKVGCAEIES